MSDYTDSIDNHKVHSKLSQTDNLFAEINAIEDLPRADVENLQRIEFIFNNFKESLSSSDKRLVSVTWLNDIDTAVNQINSNLTAYKTSKNAGHITNIVNQLDVILNNTVKINTIRSKENLRGIMSSISKHQKTLSHFTSQILQENKQFEFTKQRISNGLLSLEVEINEKSSEFQATINQEKVRLDTLITSHHNQMADNKREFQDQQKEFSDGFDSSKKEFADQGEVIFNKFKLDSDTLVTTTEQIFEKYKDDVKNIVGILNTNMFSHKYKEVADNAHKRARFWHGTAIVLMLILAGFAFCSFVVAVNQNTSWVQLIAKIFAATTIATGSAYAARQASKQEKVERYSRKIEMEMVAIDPFLESLSEEQRQNVKQEIALSIFGKADSMEITNKDEAHNALDKFSTAEDALAAVVKLIAKMK